MSETIECVMCGFEFEGNPDDPKDLCECPQCVRRQEFREKFRAAAMAELECYIDEAEHQDGEGYWDNFDNLDEAMRDFILTLKTTYEENENEN